MYDTQLYTAHNMAEYDGKIKAFGWKNVRLKIIYYSLFNIKYQQQLIRCFTA